MNYFLLNFLIDFFLVFFPVFFIARKAKKTGFRQILAELGIKNPGAKFFFKKTTFLFITLVLVSLAMSALFIAANFNDTQQVYETLNSLKLQSIPLLFYLLIVRVTAEEIFFRGFLAKKAGIWPSSILFGLAHASYGSVAEIISTFVLGLVLAKTFLKNNNLMPNIFAHIFYNFFVLGIAFQAGM